MRIIAACICAVVLLAVGSPSMVVAQQASTSIPGIDASDLPLLIVFTHDDNTNEVSQKYVTEITDKHKNPNGCTIKAAFYTTERLSDCDTVKALYDDGHEIGEHTMTHSDLYRQVKSSNDKSKEILGAREFLVSCGVPEEDVVGHRSPYLSDTPTVRKILSDAGYLYDASIPEYYPSSTSPNATHRLFPYLLADGIPQDCSYFGNINHCQSSEKYPNLWEMPLYQYQKGPYMAATKDLMDPNNAFEVLKRDFNDRYDGNRAPLGIWTHSTTTNYLNNQTNRNEISDFLSYALVKPDVWVVTPRQLIEWMKSPVKASEMSAWMDRYGCTGGGKTPKGVEAPTTPVPTSSAPLPSPPLTPTPKEAEPSAPSTSVPPETSGAAVKLERPRFNFIG